MRRMQRKYLDRKSDLFTPTFAHFLGSTTCGSVTEDFRRVKKADPVRGKAILIRETNAGMMSAFTSTPTLVAESECHSEEPIAQEILTRNNKPRYTLGR